MKKLSRIITLVLVAVLLCSFALGICACTNDQGKEGELKITFYEGGFGKQWLEDCLNDFVAMKKSQGQEISYNLISDASVTTNVTTYITSGKNLSDIYMTQGNTSWSSWVTQDYLANLNDVYEAEVEKLDGSKIKVKDFLLDDMSSMYYMQKVYGQGASAPWVMPWSLLETSIIVNEDLLHKTPKSSGGYWTSQPTTMVELADLCADINTASAADVYGLGANYVSPLSWAQNGINYFSYIIYVLWAQRQGIDTSRISGEGSYYDFWNFESPDVWKQTGIQSAIDQWRTIVTDGNGNWANTVPNFEQRKFRESAEVFCQQKAVMLLGGSFFENEMRPYLDRNNDGEQDFTFCMINVPFGENCLQANGHNAVINYCACDDMMFVPAKATNVGLAKEFLAFMCNEKYLLDFTKKTGCLRPFNYDPIELTKDDSSVKWSHFFMSCFNMMDKADYNIFTFPKNAYKSEEGASPFWIFYQPQLFEGVGVTTACLSMKTKTGAQIMVQGDDSVLALATKTWNRAKTTMGL